MKSTICQKTGVFMRVILCLFLLLSASLSASLYDAVVKIYQTRNLYDYESPWSSPFQERMGGSGFVIEGNRILTNAHVISDAVFIQVKKPGDVTKYEAEVEWIGPECDLALLKIEDETFFEGVEPLTFAHELAVPHTEVKVAGYPVGGEDLSITKGIVSRTEVNRYAFSGQSLLCSQVDSPINPGNSGGPVLEGDVVVGVAHQLVFGGQNIGYMIPIPVVKHFLQEVKENRYHGFPNPNFIYQSMENPALRVFHELDFSETGVLITRLYENSPFYGVIFPGDVLLAIDGIPISNDGTVQADELRGISLLYLFSRRFFEDEVTVDILREGERKTFTIPIEKSSADRGIQCRVSYNQRPTYFVAGGLVFQPLTLNYLATFMEDDFPPLNLVCRLKKEKEHSQSKELVVLTRILPDLVNTGYQYLVDEIVQKVNGKPIRHMQDLVEAFEESEEPYFVIELDQAGTIVLDRELLLSRQKKILNNYYISMDRSDDLK